MINYPETHIAFDSAPSAELRGDQHWLYFDLSQVPI